MCQKKPQLADIAVEAANTTGEPLEHIGAAAAVNGAIHLQHILNKNGQESPLSQKKLKPTDIAVDADPPINDGSGQPN